MQKETHISGRVSGMARSTGIFSPQPPPCANCQSLYCHLTFFFALNIITTDTRGRQQHLTVKVNIGRTTVPEWTAYEASFGKTVLLNTKIFVCVKGYYRCRCVCVCVRAPRCSLDIFLITMVIAQSDSIEEK